MMAAITEVTEFDEAVGSSSDALRRFEEAQLAFLRGRETAAVAAAREMAAVNAGATLAEVAEVERRCAQIVKEG